MGTLTLLIGHLRTVARFGIIATCAGLLLAFARPRQFVSGATLTVESGDLGNLVGLAGLASQFGLSGSLPTGETWSDDLVAQLLRSTTLLRAIVVDSVSAPRTSGQIAIADLLRRPRTGESDSARQVRIERAAEKLSKKVMATTDRRTNAITLVVMTRWPQVSFRVAERLIADLDAHLFRLAQDRARSERRSLEARIAAQDSLVDAAEDAAAAFMLANRGYELSPVRLFEYERLQREVTLRQQVRVTLAESREQMIAKEVRAAPLVTTVEAPRRAIKPEARRVVLHGAAGLLAGVCFAVFFVLAREGLRQSARLGDPTARDLLAWMRDRPPSSPAV